MAKKNVNEAENVAKKIESLPKASTKAAPKKPRPKKAAATANSEEDIDDELTIDGMSVEENDAETEKQQYIQQAEEEGDLDKIVGEVTKEITNEVNKRLAQAFGNSKKKVKYAKEETLKQMAKESKTTDAYYLSEEERVKNDYDLFMEETAELVLAADDKKADLKTVHINGCEPDPELSWCAVGYIKHRGPGAQYKIKIPASELTVFTQEDLAGLDIKKDSDIVNAIKDIVSRWVGTDVQVKIKFVYQEKNEALASRLAASERLARWNFRKQYGNSGKPRFGVGDKVKAEVVEVKRDRLKVSVYGQDTWIKSSEVAWAITGKITDLYHVGDKVNVLITDIVPSWVHENKAYNVKYTLSLVEASIKQCKANPIIKKFENKYLIDGEYEANVLYQLKNGRIMCITDDMVNIVGTPAAVGKLGKVVKIKISGKDPKSYQIWGDIVNPNVR